MKDPAFLFYSNDFYGGTRMMLPEERACYIDLMIYQHQNGYIPNDIKRLLMYCSGIAEATLIATLEAKFKLCDKGWYNERLKQVTDEREIFAQKQSVNGTVGQFWKKAKIALKSKKEYDELRKKLQRLSNQELLDLIKQVENENYTTPEAMLQALLKLSLSTRVEIEIEDENIIIDEREEGGTGETVLNEPEKLFEDFRVQYDGTKRGFSTEFEILRKHKDWKNVLPKLLPAILKERKWKEAARQEGRFCPDWPNLSTWLNQRRWEQEFSQPQNKDHENRTTKNPASNSGVSDDYKRSILERMGVTGSAAKMP